MCCCLRLNRKVYSVEQTFSSGMCMISRMGKMPIIIKIFIFFVYEIHLDPTLYLVSRCEILLTRPVLVRCEIHSFSVWLNDHFKSRFTNVIVQVLCLAYFGFRLKSHFWFLSKDEQNFSTKRNIKISHIVHLSKRDVKISSVQNQVHIKG